MSWSVWTFVEEFDSGTKEWKPLNVFLQKDGEYKKYDFDSIGNADYAAMDFMFSDYTRVAERPVPKADDMNKELADFFYKKDEDGRNFFGWGGQAVWFDYVELELLNESNVSFVKDTYAEPIDYDLNGDPIYNERNVLKSLYSDVTFVVNMYRPWDYVSPGQIRVYVARTR